MERDKMKAIIEAILFSAGRPVEAKELMASLEICFDDLAVIMEEMIEDYNKKDRGIQIVKTEYSYQLCTKTEFYEYIYPVFDKRGKPNLSQAALEVLSIIAYNPKITRAEIEAIRGVNSDGSIYKLLEYELIQDAGKMDAPGRPTMYTTTKNFLKMFGLTNLEELPELPRYKLDENEQIVIDDLVENVKESKNSENNQDDSSDIDNETMNEDDTDKL